MALGLSVALTDTPEVTAFGNIPGFELTVTGLSSSARRTRVFRDYGDGAEASAWAQSEEITQYCPLIPVTSTTAYAIDFLAPATDRDPDDPSQGWVYNVSQYIESTDVFASVSAESTDPGGLDRGSTPWLLHPTIPALSCPVTLESDLGRRHTLIGGDHPVAGRPNPLWTTDAVRLMRAGSLTVNIAREYRGNLIDLFRDGSPIQLRQPCRTAITDDAWMLVRDVTEEVIVGEVCRFVIDYQQSTPGRLSPPSLLDGTGAEWWL